jgi:signal transduction histidine kinase
LIGPEPTSQDLAVQTGAGQQHFHVNSLPLLHDGGRRYGQVYVIEDVTLVRQTQRRLAQSQWAQAALQEREQLACELHDGLSQSLAFLNLQAQAAQLKIQAGQSQEAQAILSQIQEDTREWIGNLLSVSQPAENFWSALCQVLARFEQQTGLAVHLEINGETATSTTANGIYDATRLAPQVAVQLVRVTQEALANVRKHARGASQVCVQLKTSERHLTLTILDNGAGFDLHKEKTARKNFGLQIMRQRAAHIGGKFAIYSAPGMGTRVAISAPIADNELWSNE